MTPKQVAAYIESGKVSRASYDTIMYKLCRCIESAREASRESWQDRGRRREWRALVREAMEDARYWQNARWACLSGMSAGVEGSGNCVILT